LIFIHLFPLIDKYKNPLIKANFTFTKEFFNFLKQFLLQIFHKAISKIGGGVLSSNFSWLFAVTGSQLKLELRSFESIFERAFNYILIVICSEFSLI